MAGDCTGSAYIFSPSEEGSRNEERDVSVDDDNSLLSYKLAFEIECGATVRQ